MRMLALALPLLALLLAGCSSGSAKPKATATLAGTPVPSEDASAATLRQLNEVLQRQWGLEWDELHPAEQAVIPRQKYVDCNQATAVPQITNIRVVKTYDDPFDEPEIPEKTSKAVTLSYTVTVLGKQQTQSDTFHEINVAGRWRWTLVEPSVAAYQKGQCPP